MYLGACFGLEFVTASRAYKAVTSTLSVVLSTGKKLAQHVLPTVIKPMRVLWNEVIGFLFLAIAVIATPSAYRHVRNFDGEPQSLFRLLLTCFFALLMLGFGIASFLRARRISRS